VRRINELASHFRELNHAVIYIQHDGTGTGEFEKYAPEWEILENLMTEPVDIRIDKYANDVCTTLLFSVWAVPYNKLKHRKTLISLRIPPENLHQIKDKDTKYHPYESCDETAHDIRREVDPEVNPADPDAQD
jgi:hypothetical protein